MDKRQAEILYDSGKEPTVEKLLELDDENERLKRQLAALQQDSTNSSKPPSSDGPQVKRPPHPGSPRRPGGQKGHKGARRSLLPENEMDQIHTLLPSHCGRCGKALDPAGEASPPIRHQVFELPDIAPIKIEYRTHELCCSCGHKTRAQFPPEVSMSQFGPRLHATIAYLSSVHRGTRRGVAEIMQTLFNIDISLGALCEAVERVSQTCRTVTEEVRESLGRAPVLNVDETGWKCQGQRRWLWVFVSSLAVFFHVATSRASKVLKATLGEAFGGVLASDDHSAYRAYHQAGMRQLCLAHLIRKLKGMKETRSSPDAYRFAKNLLHEFGRLFSCWHAFKRVGLTREELWLATALIRGRIRQTCRHYQNSSDRSVRTRSRRLLDNWDHLFTFLRQEGVEPTNNVAERAIRPAVQWRKISFGNQSADGERFTERILTVTRTCQLQNKNPLTFLCELMTAGFKGQPLPSLVAH